MDKAIYVAMTGAKEVLRAQTANNHNLANVTTTGFRADLTAFMSRAVEGPGHASRAYATSSTVGWIATVAGARLPSSRSAISLFSWRSTCSSGATPAMILTAWLCGCGVVISRCAR